MNDSLDIARLKKQERQYRLLFQNMTMGFALHEILLDANGKPCDYRFLEVNPAFERQTGLRAADILGKTVLEVLPQTESYWIETYGRVALTGESIQLEHYSRPLGKHYNVTAYSPEPGQFACLFLDITESVELKKRLLQAQKMEIIGALAGGIAHDFNNILFPISGLAQMLLWDTPKGSPQAESLEKIYTAARRAANLVKQILTFSQQTETVKMPILLQPVLKEVFKLTRSTIPQHIEMSLYVPQPTLRILGDSTQMHQVLMNLITNAYHAIEDKEGRIDITLEEIDPKKEKIDATIQLSARRYARIRVADTGSGIDPTIRNKIFDPYFTTKPQGKGTGLGLAVIKAIIEELNGFIVFESEVGKGTQFDILLPLFEGNEHAIQLQSGETLQKGSETILLVDDEQPIIDMEKRMLERLGYHVVALKDSQEALEVFRADPMRFDLVISDMSMPKMSGETLLMRMLSIRNDLPTILCTGYEKLIDKSLAEAIGIRSILSKPLDAVDLSKTIRNVIENRIEPSGT